MYTSSHPAETYNVPAAQMGELYVVVCGAAGGQLVNPLLLTDVWPVKWSTAFVCTLSLPLRIPGCNWRIRRMHVSHVVLFYSFALNTAPNLIHLVYVRVFCFS